MPLPRKRPAPFPSPLSIVIVSTVIAIPISTIIAINISSINSLAIKISPAFLHFDVLEDLVDDGVVVAGDAMLGEAGVG